MPLKPFKDSFISTTVLFGLDFLFNYLDDILVVSENEEQHRQHLRLVFERLNKFGLTININKCCFRKDKIEFLGHEISIEGIRPLKD